MRLPSYSEKRFPRGNESIISHCLDLLDFFSLFGGNRWSFQYELSAHTDQDKPTAKKAFPQSCLSKYS